MFIQTEELPDSEAMLFWPGTEVCSDAPVHFLRSHRIADHRLARKLLEIRGVSSVTLHTDSVTVEKSGAAWSQLKPAILAAITEHFRSCALRSEDEILLADIEAALRQVIDPELGLNVMDLGLIYALQLGKAGQVLITMTTTTIGCPATTYLVDGVRAAAESVAGRHAVNVELTYDPRWTPELIRDGTPY